MAKKIRLIIFGVLLVGLIGMSGVAFYFARQAGANKAGVKITGSLPQNGSATSTVQDSAALIEAIGKLILLPTGEEPTIATVSDPEKLKEQSFFANASVGDKVLIYVEAKKAYLYNVAQNKLIEVAPIDVGQSAATSTATTTKKK